MSARALGAQWRPISPPNLDARRDGALLGRDTLVDLLGQGRPDGPALLDRVVAHADEVSDDLGVCVLRRPERRA